MGAVPPSCHLSSLLWEVFLPDASLSSLSPNSPLVLVLVLDCAAVCSLDTVEVGLVRLCMRGSRLPSRLNGV